MNTNRLWVIGSVTVMIIALLAGWFLGIEPNLAAAATNDSARAEIETQNAVKQAEILALTEQNKNLSSIEAEYSELQKSIPASTSTAAFISSLDELAAATGVQVAAITVGGAQAYTVPTSGVAPVEPDPEAATTEEVVPEPTAVVGSVAATSPLITPENFVGISVGVDLKGSYEAVLSYLNGLQSGSRLVLVTGFASANEIDAAGVTAHIDAMIYVLKKAV